MKKTMKKMAAAFLAATMCVGIFAGCGADHEHPVITPTPTPEGWEMPTKAPEPTQAPDATATLTPTLTPDQTGEVDPKFTVDPAADAAEAKHLYGIEFEGMDAVKDMDAVIMAVAHSEFLSIDKEKKYISLQLDIDTSMGSVMDYFEIFLGRMILCRKAAEKLGLQFKLVINEQNLI